MASRGLGRVPTLALALAVPVVALVAVLVTYGVTSEDSATTSSSTAGTEPDAIRIQNFEYSPEPLVVDAGATVTVTNEDGTVHTLTADDGSFDTGDLDGGATATIAITEPGTHRYFCDVHNYMTGTIQAR
jgi:plastocyanin